MTTLQIRLAQKIAVVRSATPGVYAIALQTLASLPQPNFISTSWLDLPKTGLEDSYLAKLGKINIFHV